MNAALKILTSEYEILRLEAEDFENQIPSNEYEEETKLLTLEIYYRKLIEIGNAIKLIQKNDDK